MFRIRMNLAFGAQGDEDDWEEIASSFRQRPLETSAQYSVHFFRCVINACPVVQADSTFRHLYLRGLRTDCKCALLLNGCTSFGTLRDRVESVNDFTHPASPPPPCPINVPEEEEDEDSEEDPEEDPGEPLGEVVQ